MGGPDLAASRNPKKGASFQEEAAGDPQCRCRREAWEAEGWDEPLDWTMGGAGDRWQWLEERVAGETMEMPPCIKFLLEASLRGEGDALGQGGTSLGERGRRM